MKKTMDKKTVKKAAAVQKGQQASDRQASPIHDTSGGEMPDPKAHSDISRRDVRAAFSVK